MHSNSILTSSLLDIIFEKRNKDYGAYLLRKNYNKRLIKALIAALVFVSMFIIYQMRIIKKVTNNVAAFTDIKDPVMSLIKISEQKINPGKNISPQVKHSRDVNNRPVIVKHYKADESQFKKSQIFTNATNISDENPFEKLKSDYINSRGKEIEKLIIPAVDKTAPVISPEVLPQFPGGMKELIKFLKQNLNVPDELKEGGEIAVKVKFIVNYNGELTNIDIVDSGGNVFDNEVKRVLKKMPIWIPGRSNGKNISAYFIIPVKFTDSD